MVLFCSEKNRYNFKCTQALSLSRHLSFENIDSLIVLIKTIVIECSFGHPLKTFDSKKSNRASSGFRMAVILTVTMDK